MNRSNQTVGLLMACLAVLLILTTGMMGVSAQETTVQVEFGDVPETATPGEEFTAEYSVENVGDNVAAYTLELNNSQDNLTISSISGDIQSKSIGESTSNASTDPISSGENATVTVSYVLSENATGEETLKAEAREPISGSTDTTTHTVTIIEPDTGPSVTLISSPDTVEENSTFTLEYELNATESALTVNASPTPSGFNVVEFGGAIEAQSVDSTPPSATSSFISNNTSVTVTVEYETGSNILENNQTESEQTIGVTISSPVTGDSSENQTTVIVKESTPGPTDPTERAQRITQVDNTEEINQNDITNTITRFERGESVNGVTIEQGDITTIITLFERR